MNEKRGNIRCPAKREETTSCDECDSKSECEANYTAMMQKAKETAWRALSSDERIKKFMASDEEIVKNIAVNMYMASILSVVRYKLEIAIAIKKDDKKEWGWLKEATIDIFNSMMEESLADIEVVKMMNASIRDN